MRCRGNAVVVAALTPFLRLLSVILMFVAVLLSPPSAFASRSSGCGQPCPLAPARCLARSPLVVHCGRPNDQVGGVSGGEPPNSTCAAVCAGAGSQPRLVQPGPHRSPRAVHRWAIPGKGGETALRHGPQPPALRHRGLIPGSADSALRTAAAGLRCYVRGFRLVAHWHVERASPMLFAPFLHVVFLEQDLQRA